MVIGNPPWSATENRQYPFIDGRVKESYADPSSNTLLIALYDPYVKAVRLASDRIQEGENGGIVAFVINGGFIDSNSFDGFRKAILKEFDVIYCYNLRGNQRTAGEMSRQEGGKIFGSGSRAGVAILILVKRPNHFSKKRQRADATILYRDIGDYLSREEKLDILRESSLAETDWQIIKPNLEGDWVNQRTEVFRSMRLLSRLPQTRGIGETGPVFESQTLGVNTSRDAWCYNSSIERLRDNIERSMDFFNEVVSGFHQTNPTGSAREVDTQAKAFVTKDDAQFHWRPTNYRDLANGALYTIDETGLRIGMYRPFAKQRFYFSRRLNERVGSLFEAYPRPETKNLTISVNRAAPHGMFHTLMTDAIPDWHLTGDSVCFARWRYVTSDEALKVRASGNERSDLKRVSNISERALSEFRQHYADASIAEDDLFYYAYGVLHSEQWRETFAADLAKSPPRIPVAASVADFRRFTDAGRELADLHVNYETVDPYDLREIHADRWNPDSPTAFHVDKMSYSGKRPNLDRSQIVCNAGLTLAGIPPKAHDYRLGTRSALDWLVERYRVRTDKKSGITNDPK